MDPKTMRTGDVIHGKFAKDLFTDSRSRIPNYSRIHPMIPKLYVPEWKQDMKNRDLILKNSYTGLVPNYEHDDNLFLEKREQMSYNVEDRNRVEEKFEVPPRSVLLRPPFPHETSKYQSELMYRRDADQA